LQQQEPVTNPFAQQTAPAPTAANDVFQATDAFKRQLQEWGQYNKDMVPLAEVPFRKSAQGLASTLRGSLEDTDVWGDAGELQKGVNKAFNKFLPAQKDFQSKFTEKVNGNPVVSPGKVNTYVNQLGKPNAEIKQQMLKNYVDAAENYRDEINGMYGQLGQSSPLKPASLATSSSCRSKSPCRGCSPPG